MSCTRALAGIMRDCVPSVGGIKEVYIANYADVTKVQAEMDEITAISLSPEAKFFKYEFRQGVSTMTVNENIDPVNNTRFVSTDLMLQFNRMETSKRKELELLMTGELVVIVKDNNDKYWYLGKDEPVLPTAGDGTTGAARGDANKYSVTLQDNARQKPYEVQSSIIPDLINPAA